jgi:excisionase family DNA binding protein
MNKEVMSPKEAAEYIGISTITFYKLLKKGQVPATKFGRQWRIKKEVLDRFLEGELVGKT